MTTYQRNEIDTLVAALTAMHTVEGLRQAFMHREMDAEFRVIGEIARPMADEHIQVFTGYELAVGSEYCEG